MSAEKADSTSGSNPTPPRRTRVTLKDVGEKAGVSIGTVSDIINRGRSSNYSEETRAKVEAAMRRLGYRPVRAAQYLRRGRSNTVGVVLTRGFDNPYYARLFNEIQLSLEQNGFSAELTIINPLHKGTVRKASDWMISQGVDGVIVGPLYYWYEAVLDELRELKDTGMPIVTFGAVGGELGMHNILLHDEEGGCLAARYLIQRGHRRIAFLGAYPPVDAPRGRGSIQEGVQRVLQEHRLLEQAWFVESPDSGNYEENYHNALAFLERWLKTEPASRPTALICKTDQIAITVLAACHRLGVAVPGQLSVMGYDNVPESAYTIPALTTIDNAMSLRAAAIVQEIVQILTAGNSNSSAGTRASPEPRLIERESVAQIDQFR